MIDFLHAILDWVGAHPEWALLVVFVCCVCESIIVLGALIPTTLVLVGAGALSGLGSLLFWPVLIASVLGAIAGDSINFWVGRRWGNRALDSHYAQQYQEAIGRSRRLFERHGAKALVLARFIGLIRPFVAAIAGAYKMSVPRFLGIELFASLLWAGPLVVLGVVFGASLDLAAEVAARLAILLVVLLVVLGLLTWGVTGAVGTLQRRAESWVSAALDWSHKHRVVGRLGEWLADPEQPETPAIALLALVLFTLGAVWLWLWWAWGNGAPGPFDTLAWQAVQDLRTPFTTALALGLAQLADWEVYAPVAVTVLVTLLLLQRPQAAAHWVAAVAFGTAMSLGLYWLLKVPDPINFYHGGGAANFGGRDLVLATVIYGFLPVLLAVQRSQAVRSLFYSFAAGLVVLMLAADVYRGAVWLSTGIFSVILGAIWVLLLGIGYRRHGAAPLPAREVLPLALGVMIAAAAVQSSAEMRTEYETAEDVAGRNLGSSAWWNGAYAELPPYRIDAAGHAKQPLSVQWRGDLGRIEASLRVAGWERPLALHWSSALRWLAVSANLAELPVLPQVHAGQHQALMMRRTLGPQEQWLIRLWPSGRTVGGTPLWVGSLTLQAGRRALRLVRYPVTDKEYDKPLAALEGPLAGFEAKRMKHPQREADDAAWDGTLWLLRPK